MISPNKIIGSLVFRTREALNKNHEFLSNILGYAYGDNFLVKGKFSLWHYPGTGNEISNELLSIGKHPQGIRVKFPSILNFQPIRQDKIGDSVDINYNIAIVCLVNNIWTTQKREEEVFEHILRPIYEEFIRQIQLCNYFILDYGIPPHTYYEIFTTGDSVGDMIRKYGDCIDAIELHGLKLHLNTRLCKSDIALIEDENKKVTQLIYEILK